MIVLSSSLSLPRCCSARSSRGPSPRSPTKAPDVVLRLDDIGMNHSVNQAIEKVATTGMPFSASVLFVCPWYQEAVDILKKYPNVTVGVHVALNSEWRGYRWGPVLGKGGVPSLVDSAGYLRPSVPDFLQSKYDLAEVERELSAQMDRAMASGLKIAYLDPHMGTAAATPQLREVMERVARKYHVGISTYFDERYNSIWGDRTEREEVAAARRAGEGADRPADARRGARRRADAGDGRDRRHERRRAERAGRRRRRPSQGGARDDAVAGARASCASRGRSSCSTYEQLIAQAGRSLRDAPSGAGAADALNARAPHASRDACGALVQFDRGPRPRGVTASSCLRCAA